MNPHMKTISRTSQAIQQTQKRSIHMIENGKPNVHQINSMADIVPPEPRERRPFSIGAVAWPPPREWHLLDEHQFHRHLVFHTFSHLWLLRRAS